MLFIDSEQIRISMNNAAMEQTPFFFIINYEMSDGLFIENPASQNEVLFQFNNMGNKPSLQNSSKRSELTAYPISLEEYCAKFEIVQQGLKSGDIDVVNLTARTPVRTNLNCREIFLRSHSPYQVYIPGKFVCFSPERFVKIKNGRIWSNPMKGTIDASTPDAEQLILSDSKEIAEHTEIAKLIVEELKMVASDVTIKRFRYIDQVKTHNKTLLQVSSEIEGVLPNDYISRIGDIVFSLLPAGSITGSPKTKAREYIRFAEVQPRGYYCGVAGYFDGETLDTAVLIRFIEIENENMFFRSGGGVTRDSICINEYQEVLQKIYLTLV